MPSSTLSSHADQPPVTGRLMTLVRKGLVKPARAELPGEDAYRFRHSLICDETYAGIPKAVRAELHERFARWLQAQAREGQGFGEHDEILAYHLEQAYRYRTELVPADDARRSPSPAKRVRSSRPPAGARLGARTSPPRW